MQIQEQEPQRPVLARLLDSMHSALPSWLSGHDEADAWSKAVEKLRHAHEALQQAQRPAPARLVSAMQHAVQRIAQDETLRTVENATLIQQASVALRSYLDRHNATHPEDASTLFPVYQPVAELAQWSHVQTYDLWAYHPWQWLALPAQACEGAHDVHAATLQFMREQNTEALQEAAMQQAAATPHEAWRAAWQLLAAALEVFRLGAYTQPEPMRYAVAGVIGAHALHQAGKETLQRLQQSAHLCLYIVAQGVQQPEALQAAWARAVATRHGVLPYEEQAATDEAVTEQTMVLQHVPAPKPKLVVEDYREASERMLAQLAAVLHQWQARPDNLGAGLECTRLLQEMRELAQSAEATTMYEAVQAALVEVTLLKARAEESPDFQALVKAVAQLEPCLPQKQAA